MRVPCARGARCACENARMSSATPDIPERLVAALHDARLVTVLTGAGVSAESGVPTFRDAQQGLWAQFDPRELATPSAFARNPKRVWDWYAMRRDMVARVAPNPAHFALAELERRVPAFLLATQNVDGLHQRAGSRRVVELHGNITRVRCADEGTVVAQWQRARRRAAAALSRVRRVPAAGRRLVRGDAAGGRARRRRGRRAPLRRAARRRHVGRGLSRGRAAANSRGARARSSSRSIRTRRRFPRTPATCCAGRPASCCRRSWRPRSRGDVPHCAAAVPSGRRAASRSPVRIDSPSGATRSSPYRAPA